jgi:hypothetical protein
MNNARVSFRESHSRSLERIVSSALQRSGIAPLSVRLDELLAGLQGNQFIDEITKPPNERA